MQAWVEDVNKTVVSKFHLEVSSCLKEMGISHENEFVTDSQLFSIDIAIPDKMVAIEVDGPR